MGIFVKLNENVYSNLRTYIYKSSGGSILDRFFNVFWSCCVNIVPRSISANFLTLAGFLCSTIAFFLLYISKSVDKKDSNDYVYIYISIFLFLYQTLDAIDGKQARRTNTSSPLGQLFDHGCDSITSSLFIFIVGKAADIPKGVIFYFLLAGVQLQTYLFSWIEHHTQVYNTTMGSFGITEAQVLVISLCLFRGFAGVDKFNLKIYDFIPKQNRNFMISGLLELKSKYVVLIGACFFVLMSLSRSVYRGVMNAKKKREASSQITMFMVFLSIQYYLFQSVLLEQYEQLCFLIISLYSSVYILHMNLSNVLKVKMQMLPFPIMVYYFCIFILFLKQLNHSKINKYVGIKDIYLLCFMLIFILIYLYDYANTIITNVCKELHINFLFNKKEKEKEKTK